MCSTLLFYLVRFYVILGWSKLKSKGQKQQSSSDRECGACNWLSFESSFISQQNLLSLWDVALQFCLETHCENTLRRVALKYKSWWSCTAAQAHIWNGHFPWKPIQGFSRYCWEFLEIPGDPWDSWRSLQIHGHSWRVQIIFSDSCGWLGIHGERK